MMSRVLKISQWIILMVTCALCIGCSYQSTQELNVRQGHVTKIKQIAVLIHPKHMHKAYHANFVKELESLFREKNIKADILTISNRETARQADKLLRSHRFYLDIYVIEYSTQSSSIKLHFDLIDGNRSVLKMNLKTLDAGAKPTARHDTKVLFNQLTQVGFF